MTEQEFWDEVFLISIEDSSPGYARTAADTAVELRRDRIAKEGENKRLEEAMDKLARETGVTL